MAAATKSLDTDYLSLRTVYIKNIENQKISSTKLLVSDGQGGTFWAAPQTLGALPTFNTFETSAGSYIATESNRTVRLSVSDGFTMRASTIYATTLNYIDVSGSIILSTSKLNINTTGFVSVHTDINTNTLTLSTSKIAPALSTGNLYFQQLKIISSVKEPINTRPFGGNSLFLGNSYDFYTTFAAVSPLALSSFTTTKQIFLSMYPYTSYGFLKMSTTMGSMYISSLSTISTLYITKPNFSTGMASISTTTFLSYSTNVSTLIELSNYSQTQYTNSIGETIACALIVQLTDRFNILNAGLSSLSTLDTTKTFMYATNASLYQNLGSKITSTLSSFTDFASGNSYDARIHSLYMFSTQLSTLSTSIIFNMLEMSNFFRRSIYTDTSSYIVSTVSSFSQIDEYLSTISLRSTIDSLPYISSKTFLSTFFLISGEYGLKSTFISSLQSTVRGINENAPYLSSLSLQSSLISTVSGIKFVIENYIESSSINSTTQGIIDYGLFNGYISSYSSFQQNVIISRSTLDMALYSTTNAVFSQTSTISTASFISTFNNLGTIYSSTFKQNFIGCFNSSITNANDYYNSFNSLVYDSNSTFYNNGYLITNVDNNPYLTYGYAYDLYFTTARLDMQSMSNYIVSTSKVQIDFNVNWRFRTMDSSYLQIYPASDRLVPVSSFLVYNQCNGQLPLNINYVSHKNGNFSEYLNAVFDKDITDPLCNLSNYATYTKRISFLLSGDEIMKTYSYPIQLNHRVLFATKVFGPGQFPFVNAYLYTSPQNNIFVSIYN